MSEERLKDLLQRAVPEAPEIRADGVAERAAAVRRRQVVAGGAALAVIASVVVGGLALRGRATDDAKVANDVPTTNSGSTAPYDVPVCPVRLPDLEDANRRIPDLGDVVAVRLCPDFFPDWDTRPRRSRETRRSRTWPTSTRWSMSRSSRTKSPQSLRSTPIGAPRSTC